MAQRLSPDRQTTIQIIDRVFIGMANDKLEVLLRDHGSTMGPDERKIFEEALACGKKRIRATTRN